MPQLLKSMIIIFCFSFPLEIHSLDIQCILLRSRHLLVSETTDMFTYLTLKTTLGYRPKDYLSYLKDYLNFTNGGSDQQNKLPEAIEHRTVCSNVVNWVQM